MNPSLSLADISFPDEEITGCRFVGEILEITLMGYHDGSELHDQPCRLTFEGVRSLNIKLWQDALEVFSDYSGTVADLQQIHVFECNGDAYCLKGFSVEGWIEVSFKASTGYLVAITAESEATA